MAGRQGRRQMCCLIVTLRRAVCWMGLSMSMGRDKAAAPQLGRIELAHDKSTAAPWTWMQNCSCVAMLRSRSGHTTSRMHGQTRHECRKTKSANQAHQAKPS